MDMANKNQRIIGLMDVDAFEAQLYARDKYNFKHQPYIVVNSYGIILSVNYPAKDEGISRSMNQNSAVRKFPGLKVEIVPNHPDWKKPLQKPKRRASFKIRKSISNYLKGFPDIIFEVSSCDEFYFDFTIEVAKRMASDPLPQTSRLPPKTILETKNGKLMEQGLNRRLTKEYETDLARNRLGNFYEEAQYFHGLIIANEIAVRVGSDLGFELSAGIGPTKILAKLAVGINKPNGFTILTPSGLNGASREMDLKNVPGLGGKCGEDFKKRFGVKKMADLNGLSIHDWKSVFNKAGDDKKIDKIQKFLLGQDDDEMVIPKLFPESAMAGKNLKTSRDWIRTCEMLEKYLLSLAQQMEERIFEEKKFNRRLAIKLEVQLKGDEIFRDKKQGGKEVLDIRGISERIGAEVDREEYIYAPEILGLLMDAFKRQGLRPQGICVKEINFKVAEFEDLGFLN